MTTPILEFSAPIWIWSNGISPASWHFVTLPKDVAENIKNLSAHEPKRGRGSIRVLVRIGRIHWETSIFPDKKSHSYLLPLKADIRKQLDIKEGDTIGVVLELI